MNQAERVANAKLRLPEVRKARNQLELELKKIENEVWQMVKTYGLAQYGDKTFKDAVISLQTEIDRRIMNVNGAIIAHDEWLANELPDGDELVEWKKRQRELEQRLAEHVEIKRNVNARLAILRSKVMELEPTVNRLRFQEQTLLKLARGLNPDSDASWIEERTPGPLDGRESGYR